MLNDQNKSCCTGEVRHGVGAGWGVRLMRKAEQELLERTFLPIFMSSEEVNISMQDMGYKLSTQHDG